MSVEIDPVELGFRRPFTIEVAQILKIKNTNTTPVAFKVKTTAPKQYCVRPNSGRIEPDHEVEVIVLLQAMKQEPPLDTKCRDKFLVQSVGITADKEFNNVQQIWDSVEKSAVQEKKIRVVFLPAVGSLTTAAAMTPVRNPSLTNGAEATPEPPSYSSPSEDTTSNTTPAPVRESAFEKKREINLEPDLERAETVVSQSTSASTKPALESSADELKVKLAQAEAMIASLKLEGGVRLRKGVSAVSEKVDQQAPQVAQAVRRGTEGVPIKIAAILCLLSFLLAYFLF